MESRRWVRVVCWALLFAVLVAVGVAAVHERLTGDARRQAERRAQALPVLGAAPSFALTNRDGAVVRDGDLAGTPWIADFIFTRCVSSCPVLSARMARLDAALPATTTAAAAMATATGGVRLVSFSVDPAFDTPAVLQSYAHSFAASPRWLFLTGDERQMLQLSRHGFKLALEEGGTASGGAGGTGGQSAEPILHSTLFVLVDAHGAIRGYYQALDPAALKQLGDDARALAALAKTANP